jgi:hypothetical protein
VRRASQHGAVRECHVFEKRAEIHLPNGQTGGKVGPKGVLSRYPKPPARPPRHQLAVPDRIRLPGRLKPLVSQYGPELRCGGPIDEAECGHGSNRHDHDVSQGHSHRLDDGQVPAAFAVVAYETGLITPTAPDRPEGAD